MNEIAKMSLHEAWSILGRDSFRVLNTIKQLPRGERVQAAKKILEKAKKMAAQVAAQHHPDVGGDPEKFRMVWDALRVIEEHTKEFEMKMNELEKKIEEKKSKTTISFN